jgi:hypothetical protein
MTNQAPVEQVLKAKDIDFGGVFEDHPDGDSDRHPSLGYCTIQKVAAIVSEIRRTKHSLS